MDEAVEAIIGFLNDENYRGLKSCLDKYKGAYACLYLLMAMEDDRCHCPSNYRQVVEQLDAILIDRRPKVF